jgi:UDP-N-acetylglucosamine pyrophosphorylase
VEWAGYEDAGCRVICQPLVPVVSVEDGRWVLPQSLAPMMKPGGHGAIWKLMLDRGAFSWLASRDRQAALVRQIRCGIYLNALTLLY